MLPFTKRNARLDELDSDLVGTGEIEVVEPRLTPARARSIRPIAGHGAGHGAAQQARSGRSASVAPPAYSQAAGINGDEEESTRIMDNADPQGYPNVIPAAGSPPPARASVRPPSYPSARASSPPPAMREAAMREAAQTYADEDERTIARPISSAPPAMTAKSGARVSNRPPSLSIRTPQPSAHGQQPHVPAMLEEQERTAMMQVPAGMRARAVTMETPATMMAPAAAIPAELRQHVLAQMQASRAANGSAMDQAIAAQLANVQRAQPISPPAQSAAHLRMPQSTNSAMAIDAPPTVLTARIKAPNQRTTMTWAAALVSMGVFVGLVTAAVVRKDNEAEAAAQAARNQQMAAATQMANATTMGSGAQAAMYGQQAQATQAQAPQQMQGAQAAQQTQMPNSMGAASNPNAIAMNGAMNGNGTGAPLGSIAGNGLPASANQNSLPVGSITPEQLAAMTSGQAVANPNTVANAVVTPADSTASAPTTHHSSHARTARSAPADTVTPVAAAAPAPRPTPAPSHARKPGGPSDDDVNSAAKALAKAQLEQSL